MGVLYKRITGQDFKLVADAADALEPVQIREYIQERLQKLVARAKVTRQPLPLRRLAALCITPFSAQKRSHSCYNAEYLINRKRKHMNMDDILQDFSPASAALAIDADHIAYNAHFATLPGAEIYDEGGVRWFTTGLPHDTFNGVLQMRVEPTDLHATIEHALSYFKQRQLPFLWHLGSSSRPADCGPILQAHGLTYVETEPGMAVDLLALHEDIPVSSRITIQPVTTREELMQWIRVWLFPVPEEDIQQFFTIYTHVCLNSSSPLRLYLGILDGKPVTTSALHLAAGVAGIHHIVTLPEVRGQGIGATMTLMAAREARAQGYRMAVLTASPMGINIYRRLGFREYGTFSTYLWHPTRS